MSDGRRTGLLDEIADGGFRLLVTDESLALLNPASLAAPGVTVIAFDPCAAGAVASRVRWTQGPPPRLPDEIAPAPAVQNRAIMRGASWTALLR
ncbi:hypothetical protein ACIQU1_17630 [Streptomyces angustmyceticus]|uniref:hypothetical protein n=1 Tax=Streptomyces angustmyceticus TaxID=285578 RepID=UPI00380932A3